MEDGVNRFQAYLSLSLCSVCRRPLFTLICAMSDRDFYASPLLHSNPIQCREGEEREEGKGWAEEVLDSTWRRLLCCDFGLVRLSSRKIRLGCFIS